MLSPPQWTLLGLAVLAQLVLGVLGLAYRMTAHNFYYLSTLTMALATGVLLSVPTGWAAAPGTLGVAFAVAAATEPGRRRRHQSLVRQLGTLKGWPRS